MTNIEEKAGLCALNRVFGFSPRKGRALISETGSAAAALEAGHIPAAAYEMALRELEDLDRKGIRFVGMTEDDYPSLLKECPDPPIGLYVRTSGKLSELFSPRRRISIVGTRDISGYGKEWCCRIVSGLASSPEKPAIISGLALGTDITAHTAALDAGLPTIGVMATGPDTIYPHRHRAVAERMVSTPGCGLITDYPPGTAPLAVHFLRRNRIIAGLGEATVLVESKIKGGGMVTARLAFSYSRDVFALPGRIDDLRSQGCNLLIKEKIAEPVTDIGSMMLDMGFGIKTKVNTPSVDDIISRTYGSRVSQGQIPHLRSILAAIRNERGITIEEVAAAARIPAGHAISLCALLESDGIITIDILQRCSMNPRKSELFF